MKLDGCNHWILTLQFFLLVCTLNGQVQINGTVSEKDTGEPLPLVSVTFEDYSIEALTDEEGFYTIALPSSGMVSFSYLGYTSVSFEVTESGIYNIQLSAENSILLEDNSAVTISGRAIQLKLPAPLMQIYPEHLKRDVDISITPALNRVTGLYMHSGALNTNRITIRGVGNRSLFSTTKIRAYLDDIPLTSGDGETTIEDIDLSLIRKVDVWKGPTASIYGAGLGGMIHLRSGIGLSQGTEIENKTTIGSYGLIRNVLRGNYLSEGKELQIGATLNTTHSDGYRENNAYDRAGANIFLKYVPNTTHETSFFGNYIDLKAFIPSSLSRDDYLQTPEKAAFTWGRIKGFEEYNKSLFGLSHKLKLVDMGQISLINKSSLFGNSRNSYESRPFNILEEESTSLGIRSTFELHHKGGQKNRLPLVTVGIESFREKYEWKTFETNDGAKEELLSDNDEVRRNMNIFLQSYLSLGENVTLLSGLNFNTTRYSYKDLFLLDGNDSSGDYNFGSILSPHIGLSYQFNYTISLFTTISHGFSPPSLSETLTPDGQINPEIQPEKGWNFEIGSRGKINSKFTYELTAYTMQINDLLVSKRVSEDQFVGLNAGRTNHNGIELYLEYKTEINPHVRATPFLSYTYSNYQFEDFVDGDNDYSGNELTGTPPHQLDMGLDISSSSGFYSSINYRFIDAFPMRDDNSIYSESYHVSNIKVGFEKEIFDSFEVDVSFGMRNIFNEKYASMILINAGSFGGNPPRYYYPGLPRNYFASVSVKYLWR